MVLMILMVTRLFVPNKHSNINVCIMVNDVNWVEYFIGALSILSCNLSS